MTDETIRRAALVLGAIAGAALGLALVALRRVRDLTPSTADVTRPIRRALSPVAIVEEAPPLPRAGEVDPEASYIETGWVERELESEERDRRTT